jgi:hypothetical protein
MKECTFNVTSYKAGSARVVFFKDLRQWNCYTLEGSFFGSAYGKLKEVHLNTAHYEAVGMGLAQAVTSSSHLTPFLLFPWLFLIQLHLPAAAAACCCGCIL